MAFLTDKLISSYTPRFLDVTSIPSQARLLMPYNKAELEKTRTPSVSASADVTYQKKDTELSSRRTIQARRISISPTWVCFRCFFTFPEVTYQKKTITHKAEVTANCHCTEDAEISLCCLDLELIYMP